LDFNSNTSHVVQTKRTEHKKQKVLPLGTSSADNIGFLMNTTTADAHHSAPVTKGLEEARGLASKSVHFALPLRDQYRV
jgi:hypothetical protein